MIELSDVRSTRGTDRNRKMLSMTDLAVAPADARSVSQSPRLFLQEPQRAWSSIVQPETYLVAEQRDLVRLSNASHDLLELPPYCRAGRGSVDRAIAALGELPEALLADIADLAKRFCAVAQCSEYMLDSTAVYDILLMRRVRKNIGGLVIQTHKSFGSDQGCGRWTADRQAGRSAWPACASIAKAFARRGDSSSIAAKSREEMQRV